MDAALESARHLMERGGWVMWPLLGLSVVAVALIFERSWFWLRTNNPIQRSRVSRISQLMRRAEWDKAALLVEKDRSVYGQATRLLVSESVTQATVADAIVSQRYRMERFMPTLGTIITAAPMLGILGTVTGIIRSFHLLSQSEMMTDPGKIGSGIAEALLTTVAGLIVALVVLFPYNAFRAQIDRTLGRLETLAAAAQHKDSDAPANDGD